MIVTPEVLRIDAADETRTICTVLQRQVRELLRRKGVVVGLSGGVDSAVVVALAARALGPTNVFALAMPERDSSRASLALAKAVAKKFGVHLVVEDITATLVGAGCYRRQIEAIQVVFPDYDEGWTCKLTLPSVIDADRISVSRLTVRSPDGEEHSSRMPAHAYRALVAATNMKQRARKAMEYYHGDRLAYAVAGTPNRLEYDQGFFVKQGDGAADVKPIAHLYKTQVYALAEHLGVPEAVRTRPPTTDTFSMPQTQEEFYFALPYSSMDLCLWARDHAIEADDVADSLSLSAPQVERVYRDIDAKRRTTRYLHLPPLTIESAASLEAG